MIIHFLLPISALFLLGLTRSLYFTFLNLFFLLSHKYAHLIYRDLSAHLIHNHCLIDGLLEAHFSTKRAIVSKSKIIKTKKNTRMELSALLHYIPGKIGTAICTLVDCIRSQNFSVFQTHHSLHPPNRERHRNLPFLLLLAGTAIVDVVFRVHCALCPSLPDTVQHTIQLRSFLPDKKYRTHFCSHELSILF